MDCLGFKSKCVKDKLAFENLIEKDQDLDRWTAPGKENTPYQAERGRVFFLVHIKVVHRNVLMFERCIDYCVRDPFMFRLP